MASTTASPAKLRSLYRAILRELPPRPILARERSPLRMHLRSSFDGKTGGAAAANSNNSNNTKTPTPDVASELVTYLRSQRMYATLLERYNPGMDMDDTERIRLTARRVGMDLPVTVGKGDEKA
ncbi:hypothetical protein K4F52_002660 [Lecanicillium sp. MT-2017a]|nr:hypothetical protein K4F52_002660 [Lecanicillium sp. MT-2017a]